MISSSFKTSEELENLIETYFNHIEGEYHLDEKPLKESKSNSPASQKVWDREAEPATIAGLSLFLGFNGRQAFEDYCNNGEFETTLNRGRLRIEAFYEKKLHNQSSTGAIFALKNMGWNEKPGNKPEEEKMIRNLKIELIECGPKPAESEKEVVL